ncbi:5-(carboxyamino)imidazole ribonucleotide synthase [Paludifilum halophilum]|uniref:N5-carboxyaminoimidazole ribonucleotide synthase n=1 Tax=Paludifilum halophilum TaxID=1642702 RepID=A0A235B6N7_9BACL|nr:5-(carboxyamino)imidazole ribonucleotide synthase [Paludifilum halophilum]OYD07547.1 5-(carboxyamino)imidazole ribonucleotide synthase [Paludifilum halophilum]
MTVATVTEGKKTILPGSTVGILGGGQLGRMVALEGKRMGYRFVTLDPSENCSGGQAADRHLAAGYDDWEAAERLAEASDVITYEFENVDLAIVDRLRERTYLPQGSRLLHVTRHRAREKRALEQAGLPVTPYLVVQSREELLQGLKNLGAPCVLKTVTGGYDGKGQWMIRSREEGAAFEDWNEGETRILEQFVPFVKEISVIAARSSQGEVRTFTPVENIHRNHILHLTLAPAPVEESVLRKAEALARQVADQLDVVGLIAVEMFLLEDGHLLINELAPRPHNSGHFSYDACATSQFEQHLRAICGLPLGSPRQLTPAVMVNVLGEHVEPLLQCVPRLPSSAKVHLYGKEGCKPGRKMGHVTVLGESVSEAMETIRRMEIWPE